jgi:uncharacterized membrane protein
MELLRAVALVLATMSMGMMAGIFALYSHTVMPGLRRTDDRTFVGAFQALDRAIINPWFMVGGFMGALLLTMTAAVLHIGVTPVLPWTLVALVLYVVVVAITFRVNLPRNNAIKAAGDPDGIGDLAAVRERFDEALWLRWNHVRTVLTSAALASLAWALVQHGAAG